MEKVEGIGSRNIFTNVDNVDSASDKEFLKTLNDFQVGIS